MASATQKFEMNSGKQPREEQIRRRAYELYLNRGGTDGLQEQDWLQAQAELEPPLDQEPDVK
jgi:hypothetical protein